MVLLWCLTFARLAVAAPIPGLYSTGVDDSGAVLPDTATDPHYIFSFNPDSTATAVIVHDSTVFPIVAGPWMPNNSLSKWVGPRADTAAAAGGSYTYKLTFVLNALDPNTARITGKWTSDNNGVDILINGHPTGQSQGGDFVSFAPFTISSGFVEGTNTIEFIVANIAPGPTALRVQDITGTASPFNIPPSITTQPQNQTVAGGDRARFVVEAEGSSPLSYQWRFNSNAISGANSSRLTLTNVTGPQSGNYDVIVTNNSGAVTSAVAVLTVVGQRIPGLFNSGVDDNSELRDARAPDLHYALIRSGDPAFPGPATFVVSEGFPIPPWMANGPNSKWIAPFSEQSVGNAAGDYVFRINFDMSGLDLAAASIAGGWAVDNSGTDILLNGTSLGIANLNAFFNLTSFSITNGFIPGINTLDFIVNNGAPTPNPLGLRVELTGVSMLLPPNTPPSIIEQPQSQTVETDQSVTFAVRPNGSSPFTYQWRFNGTNISGATTRTYTIASAASTHSGLYDVIVSNSGGSVMSSAASLTVVTPSLTPTSRRYEPPGPSTHRTGLIISEIMFHPLPRGDGKNVQFIELYNSNPFFEDLSGFRITGDVGYTFPPNTLLSGNSFVVVAAVPAHVREAYGATNVLGPFTNSLPAPGGTVSLVKKSGAVVLNVEYSADDPWPIAAGYGGHSLVLAKPSFGENDVRAWAASAAIGGSPGQADPIPDGPLEDLLINELVNRATNAAQHFVELYNHSAAEIDISGCILTDDTAVRRFRIAAGTTLPARGMISFSSTAMGFMSGANGKALFLLNPQGMRVLDALKLPGEDVGIPIGRFPDGSPALHELRNPTPGTPNAQLLIRDVVINEIMFNPISGSSEDEFIELHNKGSSAVNIGGWQFTTGVTFTFPQNTLIPADGYLVVANEAAHLMSNYINLNAFNTVGDYKSALANSGERLTLAAPYQDGTNLLHVVIDQVDYHDGGRWGQWADGGGSSLELIDARSDNRLAANWADSDESAKGQWTFVEHSGRLDLGTGPCDQLQLFLQGEGEALVDDIEVFQEGGNNVVANGNFEGGTAGWFFQGTHSKSAAGLNNGYNSFGSLDVRASGRGDYAANRIRTPLSTALTPGSNATIRAKVRWLRGHPEILFRTKGNYLEAVGQLAVPKNLGTPGARNSKALNNAPPAIWEVFHSPLLPAANQPIAITARVHDADGLGPVILNYRIDPAAAAVPVTMTDDGSGADAIAGDGIFTATIPGQSSGTLIAFSTQATDRATPAATSKFPNDAPTRECLVRVGDPPLSNAFGTYRIWMTQATFTQWSTREKLSNEDLDVTFIYGRNRIIYNAGAHYSGSSYTSPGYDTPTGNLCGYNIITPKDDTCLGDTDFTLDWPVRDATNQREQLMFWFLEQYGLPNMYRRYINLFVNGVKRGVIYDDVQQPSGDVVEEWYPNDSEGTLLKTDCWNEFDDNGTRIDPCILNTLEPFLTTDGQKKVARYRWNWKPRAIHGTANDFSDLFALVDAVNVTGSGYQAAVEQFVDVENWMRTFAMNDLASFWDAFGNPNGKNTFLYKPTGAPDSDPADWHRAQQVAGWKLLSWDFDVGLGVFFDPPNAPLFTVNDPVVGRMYAYPAFVRAYWRALDEAVNTFFRPQAVQAILAAKFAAFQANGIPLTSPFVPSGEQNLSIPDWITQRRNFLLQQIGAVQSAFAITSNNGNDFSSSRNYITLTGTAPVNVKWLQINGVTYDVNWTSVTQWSVTVVLQPGVNNLVVQGLDLNGQPIGSAFDSIHVTFTGTADLAEQSLIINEIMYHPAVANGQFVEIYNRSLTSAFSLPGYRVEGVAFTFPSSAVILPGSFLVIAQDAIAFRSIYGASIPLAGQFSGRLDSAGETLSLVRRSNGSETVINQVRYGASTPWPPEADGSGPSLQLIDPSQDNRRVANWAVNTNSGAGGLNWQFVTVTGTASSSRLYVYLTSAGDVFLDDITIVEGATPGVGPNHVQNGNFESPLSPPWNISTNHADTVIDSTRAHSGSASLHLIASSGGSSQATAVWQDTIPLNPGAQYTLSYWYLPSTNGSGLTMRLSGSGINSAHPIAPDVQLTDLYTPGRANSVRATLPRLPQLWINELQPNNLTGVRDATGQHEPWLEIFNAGTNAVALDRIFLTDNYADLMRWSFPTGSVINAGEFKLVFADGEMGRSTRAEPHTIFRLASAGGSLALVEASDVVRVLDYLDYTEVFADRSHGSLPDGQSISRRDFFYPTPGAPNNGAIPPGFVLINEWMASNDKTLRDPADGKFADWFELYNPSTSAVNLGGYYLSDSLANKIKFPIPSYVNVPARGFLLVWADGDIFQNTPSTPDLHVNFSLDKDGEAIALFTAGGALVDAVTFGLQSTDISEGRFPDGTGPTYAMTAPTPRSRNVVEGGNRPPTLALVSDKVIYFGQTLSFTASAVDPDVPPQSLAFSLGPGAPNGASIDSASGLFRWTPSLEQTPSTNYLTVRVTDDGSPPLDDQQTFVVFVVSPPRFIGISRTGDQVTLTWQTSAGKRYHLEYKNDLSETNWTSMRDFTASADTISVVDETGGAPQRFYRLFVVP